MKLTKMHLDGYGIFSDLTIDGLSPRVSVLEGPNEAGKTTLMSFIRSVLFGFAARGSADRGEPLAGGRHGGSLFLEGPNGEKYQVTRTEGRSKGEVKVYLPDRTVAGESFLNTMLGGISKNLYQNVFAFGLMELQRLETLNQDEITGYIYSAGMGGGSVSIVEVDRQLQKEMEELFKTGGQKPEINRVLKILEDEEDEIIQLQKIPDEYHRLQQELAGIIQNIEQSEQQYEELDQEIRWLEKLIQVKQNWERLQEVKILLASLPEIDGFPEAGVERLAKLEQELSDLHHSVEETEKVLELKTQKMRQVTFNPALLHHASQIQELNDNRVMFGDKLRRIPELKKDLANLRQQIAQRLQSIGAGWTETDLEQFDTSFQVQEQVRQYQQQFQQLEEAVKETRLYHRQAMEKIEEKEAEKNAAREKWEQFQTPEAPTDKPIPERQRALDLLQHGSNTVVRLREELEHRRQRIADLERQKAELEQDKVALLTINLVMAVPVAIAFALLLFLTSGMLAGVSAMVAGGLGLFFLDRINRANRKTALEREKRIEQRIAEVTGWIRDEKSRTDRLQIKLEGLQEEITQAALCGLGKSDFTEEEISAARRALQEEEKALEHKEHLRQILLEKEQNLQKSRQELQRARKQWEQASGQLQKLQTEWESWLSAKGLEPNLACASVLDLIRLVEDGRNLLEQRKTLENKLQQYQAETEQFYRQANLLLTTCGQDQASMEELAGALLRLQAELSQALQLRQQKEKLADEIEQHRLHLESLQKQREKKERELEALLGAGGTNDKEEFRKRERQYQERMELVNERALLEARISALFDRAEEREKMEEQLVSSEQGALERRLSAAKEKRDQVKAAISAARDQKGKLSQRIAVLEANEELSSAMLSFQIHLGQLRQKAGQWAVRSLCRSLLALARERYEKERQPAVLRYASEFFQIMTGGRYIRIIAPLGENRLEAERQDGARLSPAELSRGTVEQLYLAMRFALIREYGRRITSLPVVMDDILVNFDPVRFRATLEVIKEVSKEQQILFFTCHPHMAQELLKAIPQAAYFAVDSGKIHKAG